MLSTRVLLSPPIRLTLFTRANCSLCETAKQTLQTLQKRRSFEYTEVDVMVPENKQWKDVYEFDVPVLHAQPIRSMVPNEVPKLFHRFTEHEVEKLMNKFSKQ